MQLQWKITLIILCMNKILSNMAVLLPRNILLNNELLSLYEERLRRIIEECYEVAFILCNSEMEEFSMSKIFDVFNQTLTTAFILNTGYWPFYSSVKGQCLCVCGRFGIYCRHIKNEYHWIDMQPVDHGQGAIRFFPKLYGEVYPQDYEIMTKQIIDAPYGYDVNIALNLRYKKMERARHCRREKGNKINKEQLPKKDIYKQVFTTTIYARYNIHREYYPAMSTILFQPNPFFHERYGTHFKKLCELRTFEWSQFLNDQDKFYHVSVGHMPTSTLILQHVNVPVCCIPNQVLVIHPKSQYFEQKFQKSKRSKGSQTPWKTITNENGICNKIRNMVTTWSYPEDSNVLSDTFKNIATSINLTELNSNVDNSIVLIDDSEEYDNQLPNISYIKAVKGSLLSLYDEVGCNSEDITSKGVQGLKRKYSVWKSDNNSNESDTYDTKILNFLDDTINNICETTSTLKNCHRENFNENDVSYELNESSTVNLPLCSKQEFPYLNDNIPEVSISSLNYSEAVKRPIFKKIKQELRDDDWFERKFTSRRPKLTQIELDEEFELIESVIHEDVMTKEENLQWWNQTNN